MMINDDYTWMLQNYRLCHWERDTTLQMGVEPKLGIEFNKPMWIDPFSEHGIFVVTCCNGYPGTARLFQGEAFFHASDFHEMVRSLVVPLVVKSKRGFTPFQRNQQLPSGYVIIAIENDPVDIVDFPIQHGDFP